MWWAIIRISHGKAVYTMPSNKVSLLYKESIRLVGEVISISTEIMNIIMLAITTGCISIATYHVWETQMCLKHLHRAAQKPPPDTGYHQLASEH